jgi:hypothetical protein
LYVGKYFFADFCGNWIYYLNPASPATATQFHTGLNQPVDLAVGPDGSLYYVQRGGGRVGRIRFTGQTPQSIVVSANQVEVGEGTNAAVSVRLATQPAGNVTVNITRSMSDATITGSATSIVFTPANWNVQRSFTISVAQDADNIDEGATFVFAASGIPSVRVWVTAADNNRPAGSPRAIISAPRNADTVSGANAELFGNGLDDGTVIGAQFFVDGVLHDTDVNNTGHYHIGGDHNMWNTTGLSDGQHVIMMRVFDSQGLSGSHNVSVNVNS